MLFFVLVVLCLVVVVLFCILFELKIFNWFQKELLPQRNGCVHTVLPLSHMYDYTINGCSKFADSKTSQCEAIKME